MKFLEINKVFKAREHRAAKWLPPGGSLYGIPCLAPSLILKGLLGPTKGNLDGFIIIYCIFVVLGHLRNSMICLSR